MSIWDTIRQFAGNTADQFGYRMGVPFDTGFSEWLAGGPTTNTGGDNTTPSRAVYAPENNAVAGPAIPENFNQNETSTNTQYTNTGSSGGDGGGSGGNNDITYEQPTSQVNIDWNAIYSPALNAYNELKNTIQSGLSTALGGIESGLASNIEGLETSRDTQLADYEQQKNSAQSEYGQYKSTEEGKTESAISEARRQANELMQGIQSRFGSSTGTGAFASELLGRQAMQGIGDYRTGLQQVLGQANTQLQNTFGEINTAMGNLKKQVSLSISQAQTEANQLKEQARQNVAEQLASVNATIGETETAKAQARTSALMDYQDYVREVNARNTSYQQQIESQAREIAASLQKLASQSAQEFQITLPNGQTVSALDFSRITGGLGDYAGGLQSDVLSSLSGQTTNEDSLSGTYNPSLANYLNRIYGTANALTGSSASDSSTQSLLNSIYGQ
jgi:ElaB/YqjD/DUF883 family membrane-anchored ribosome-binding protein